MDKDVASTLELIDEVCELCEELPERADDFANDVSEKCRDIAVTIEDTGRVTDKQAAAVENMHAGVLKWLER